MSSKSKQPGKPRYIYYGNVMNENQILYLSLQVNDFKHGIITYKELEDILAEDGITITPELVDFSTRMMTKEMFLDKKKKFYNKNYDYDDIHRFILSSPEYENVVFYLDYRAIKLLASAGSVEYLDIYRSLIDTQLRNSWNKNEQVKQLRDGLKEEYRVVNSKLSNILKSHEIDDEVTKKRGNKN